ncbi:MAG TPA: hypothetical protein VHV77_06865, partial [Pirellulales bacterium]|jgi:hypothetical protein|nr:hypothetical protein [Pirellulales bacterium]
MFRIGLCVVTIATTFVGVSTVASATDRTYVNTTGEDLVIYLRPVVGQQYGEWIDSGTIEPEKSWTIKVNNPPAQYSFWLYFPKSKEKRDLGLKTVASPEPLTMAVERRMRIKSDPSSSGGFDGRVNAQMEEYFELAPYKPKS